MSHGRQRVDSSGSGVRAVLEALKATIREGSSARVAIGDDPSILEGADTLSVLIAGSGQCRQIHPTAAAPQGRDLRFDHGLAEDR